MAFTAFAAADVDGAAHFAFPFQPGPGTASGKAATSPGDKESHTASGHILNSSIVCQEEMCLGNVAVTALKQHNSILTTSLRRCRSDKQGERGSRAWGWDSIALPPRASLTDLSCKPSPAGSTLHSLLPWKPCTPKGRPCTLPLGGYFDPHGPLSQSYTSFLHPGGFPRAVPAEQGELCSPCPDPPPSPQPSPHCPGIPMGGVGVGRSPHSILCPHPATAIQQQPRSGHQCLGQNHTQALRLATDWKSFSELLPPTRESAFPIFKTFLSFKHPLPLDLEH